MPTSTIDSLLAQRKQFLAFVQRRVSDSALAEDILQTAYLRAFEHRDDFKPDESAVAWFYRLLRNAVIDTYRRQASRNKALETWTRELEISAQPSPDLQDEVCACLHGVIDSLKPQDDYLASSGVGGKLLKCNGRGCDACSEDACQEVLFHGSAVEPVVELGDIAFEVLLPEPGGGFRAGSA